MKTLPVIPVEALAVAPTHHSGGNSGIVPPWMQVPGTDDGVVPPWLETTAENRNPGIVPPWLQVPRPIGPKEPVADDVPRIFGGASPTVYDPTPVDVEPGVPRILRA